MPTSLASKTGVTAMLAVYAKYMQSNPNRPYEEMDIQAVTVAVNNLTIDEVGGKANLNSWSDEHPMTLENKVYKRSLTLEQDSVYQVRVTVVRANGVKSTEMMFINTADANQYYNMDYMIRKGGLTDIEGNLQGIADALFKITPPAAMEIPKWYPGLRDSLGALIPLPTNDTELYDYVMNKITGGTIEDISDYRGQVTIQRLLPGAYQIDITKTGYQPRTATRTITSSDLSGNWDLNQL